MFDLTPEDQRRLEGLRSFLEGDPIADWSDTSLCGGAQQAMEDRVLAELDALLQEEGFDVQTSKVQHTERRPFREPEPSCDEDGGFIEKIYHEPEQTLYDKARAKIKDAENRMAANAKLSPEWNRAIHELAEGKRQLATALERDSDEGWRKRRRIDEWRAGDGREAYNASRRKIRTTANASRQSMSVEERKDHDREKAADRKARYDARKKFVAEGLSGQALAVAVEGVVKAKRDRRAKKR